MDPIKAFADKITESTEKYLIAVLAEKKLGSGIPLTELHHHITKQDFTDVENLYEYYFHQGKPDEQFLFTEVLELVMVNMQPYFKQHLFDEKLPPEKMVPGKPYLILDHLRKN